MVPALCFFIDQLFLEQELYYTLPLLCSGFFVVTFFQLPEANGYFTEVDKRFILAVRGVSKCFTIPGLR